MIYSFDWITMFFLYCGLLLCCIPLRLCFQSLTGPIVTPPRSSNLILFVEHKQVNKRSIRIIAHAWQGSSNSSAHRIRWLFARDGHAQSNYLLHFLADANSLSIVVLQVLRSICVSDVVADYSKSPLLCKTSLLI
jgi:hypothetical protein